MSLDVEGPLTLDNNLLRLEAALAGIGLVYMNEWSASKEIRAGRLLRVLQDWTPSIGRLALYYPGHRHVPAGLRGVCRAAARGRCEDDQRRASPMTPLRVPASGR